MVYNVYHDLTVVMVGKYRDAMAEHVVQAAFRFPKELIERLDAYAEKRANEMRGARVTRADVVRMLLEEGLSRAGLPPATTKRPKR